MKDSNLLQVVLAMEPSPSACMIVVDEFCRRFDAIGQSLPKSSVFLYDGVKLTDAARLSVAESVLPMWWFGLHVLTYKRIADAHGYDINFEPVFGRLAILRWFTDRKFYADVVYPFLRQNSTSFDQNQRVPRKFWNELFLALNDLEDFIEEPLEGRPYLRRESFIIPGLLKQYFPESFTAIPVKVETKSWSWGKLRFVTTHSIGKHQVNPRIAGLLHEVYENFKVDNFRVVKPVKMEEPRKLKVVKQSKS